MQFRYSDIYNTDITHNLKYMPNIPTLKTVLLPDKNETFIWLYL